MRLTKFLFCAVVALCVCDRPTFLLAQPRTLCPAIPLAVVGEILSTGTQISTKEVSDIVGVMRCEYHAPAGVLTVIIREDDDTAEARSMFQTSQKAVHGKSEEGFGASAFSAFGISGISPGDKCSMMEALEGSRTYVVGLCGPGFGAAADRPRLYDLMRRLLAVR